MAFLKILITGANGQLGRELQNQLKGQEFLAVDVNEMDILNQKQVFEVIGSYKPDALIHCAAYTNVDGAESDVEMAYKVNAVGTQNVAAACLKYDSKLVYISTDYVFDGKLGRPYTEFDTTNPQSVYGKSKLAGELLAKHILNRVYIVRTSWLYGDGNNFVRTMLRLGCEKSEISIVSDQHGCPTNTTDLAQAVLNLIQTESYGVYHAANTGVTTWCEFARKIFELSNNKTICVRTQTTAELGRPAPRPLYSPLEGQLLELVLGEKMRPWETALLEYLNNENAIKA